MRDPHYHGMVLVSESRSITPTCLCGWIGATESKATAFGKARSAWETHVELEERLSQLPGGNE